VSSNLRAPASLDLALRSFREAATACVANDEALPDVHAAITRVADLGRNAGVQPEELIVSVKQIYTSLPLEHAPIEEREALKRRFVTWLIEAYFRGRAD
jgi:hypothetical protein